MLMPDDDLSAADAVARWDAGETLWSVEMGGLGPDYEQCIQVLAVEIVRDTMGTPLPKDGDKDAWRTWGDETATRLDKTFGFSGAQVGAARSLAAHIVRKGWNAAIRSAPPDRRIQIRRDFPTAPARGGAPA